jgi:flagellar hook-length control protein FliK
MPTTTTTLQTHTETVSSQALDKFHAMKRLGSDNAGKSSDEESSGLDGFAEVFAAMAATSPRPIESVPQPHEDQPEQPLAKVNSESTADHEGADTQATTVSNDQSEARNENSQPDYEAPEVDRPKNQTDDFKVVDTPESDAVSEVTDVENKVVARAEDRSRSETANESEVKQDAAVKKSAKSPDNESALHQATAEDIRAIGQPTAASKESASPAVESSTTSTAQAAVNLEDQQGENERDDSRSETSAFDDTKVDKEKSRESTLTLKPDAIPEPTVDDSQLATQTPTSDVGNSVAKVAAIVVPTVTTSALNVGSASAAKVSAISAAGRSSGIDLGAQSLGKNVAQDNSDPKAAEKPAANGREETISRIKLMQRVGRAFQGLGAEGGTVRIRLAPDDLGSVQVEMQVKNRSVDASVIAQTEAAAATLREHLPELRSRLESMNLQVERLEVRVDSQATGQQSDQHRGHDSQSYRQSENQPRRESTGNRWQDRSRPVLASVGSSHGNTMTSSASGIDVRV